MAYDHAVYDVAIPVVVDLLLRPGFYYGVIWDSVCRNPCCSGPTASTCSSPKEGGGKQQVAIPVVVDLLLRPMNFLEFYCVLMISRNPCCSGPTASTIKSIELRYSKIGVAIPVVVDLLLRQNLEL